MALMPTTNRDKIMAIVGLAALALVVVYYMYVWQPKRDELNTSQARVDSLLVINQRAKADLAQGTTGALKAEADRLASDLTLMRQLVPTGNELPLLIDQISTAARRVGLEIRDLQPLPSLAGDQYEAFKYRLVIVGAYHQIGRLLADIGSLQRIVSPINVTLTPQQLAPNALKKSNVQPLEARFEIQTYVARTAVALPPAPKAKLAAPPAKPGEK